MFSGTMITRVGPGGGALVGLTVAARVAQGHADRAALGDAENAFGRIVADGRGYSCEVLPTR
jgi:hypothetical protein